MSFLPCGVYEMSQRGQTTSSAQHYLGQATTRILSHRFWIRTAKRIMQDSERTSWSLRSRVNQTYLWMWQSHAYPQDGLQARMDGVTTVVGVDSGENPHLVGSPTAEATRSSKQGKETIEMQENCPGVHKYRFRCATTTKREDTQKKAPDSPSMLNLMREGYTTCPLYSFYFWH